MEPATNKLEQPAATSKRFARRLLTTVLGLLLLTGCFTHGSRGWPARPYFTRGKSEANPVPSRAGPTLRLDYGRGDSPGDPVAEFMYFVPLISLEPVSIVKSPGNTQRAADGVRHAVLHGQVIPGDLRIRVRRRRQTTGRF